MPDGTLCGPKRPRTFCRGLAVLRVTVGLIGVCSYLINREYHCEPWNFDVHHFTISPYFSQTWMMGRFTGTYWNYDQWIGLGENFQENLFFLVVKTMVSCEFSLKPIHWYDVQNRWIPVDFPPIESSNFEAKKRRTSSVEKLTTFCERERGWWRNNVAPQHWRCELFVDWKNWGFYHEK
jgi:hypothetical protein